MPLDKRDSACERFWKSLTYPSLHPSHHLSHDNRSPWSWIISSDSNLNLRRCERLSERLSERWDEGYVRDEMRDESLETPLNKGFLLKNVREGGKTSMSADLTLKTVTVTPVTMWPFSLRQQNFVSKIQNITIISDASASLWYSINYNGPILN